MNNNDMVDISVEVEALNLDGIEQNLLDYVEKKAKIDIDNSVESAEKSADDASAAAIEAAASAELASECAIQASESLENYYTKTQTDNLLSAKQDTLTFDYTPASASTNPVTSGGIYTALAGKADVATTLAGYGITDGTNKDLSNLSADGQMIIDSANGTISNCILEIPQLLKLELSGNVITHKAGSVQTQCGDTYATYTVTQDRSTTISDSLADGLYYVNPSNNGTLTVTAQGKFGSGDTLPADGSTYERFFLTTDKKMYHYGSGTWGVSGLNYPVCMIKMTSGVASFAKDSNGNDMIFNGAGFVGHHGFVYPGVKALQPRGFNSDGSMNSFDTTTNALQIVALTNNTNFLTLASNNISQSRANYRVVKEKDSIISCQYVTSENLFYFYTGSVYALRYETPFIFFAYNGTTVTDFTINQPVRLATTEMLDNVQVQVDTNTTAILGKQDTLVSGTNIKTINSTTVLGNGNFALADQSLSNLDSAGQMVVDSMNGTISNCILEIPQNIKMEISSDKKTITLKSGSICVKSGSTYTTITTTADVSFTNTNSNPRKCVFFLMDAGNWARVSEIERIVSGSTDSKAGTTWHVWFDTENKEIKFYASDASTYGLACYPCCVIDIDSNGDISFAKDSNGNDMIFNGCGFIGHHVFVYPNVKGLIPNGFNADGSLSSLIATTNALTIREITNASTTRVLALFDDDSAKTIGAGFEEVYELPQNPVTNKQYYEIKSIETYRRKNKGGGIPPPFLFLSIAYSALSPIG